MKRGILGLSLVLGMASLANAAATVSLVPQNPGPYLGGETFGVDVWVNSDTTLNVRLLQLDFTGTDDAIALGDTYDFAYLGADGIYIDIFTYLEFASLTDTDGAVVNTTWTGFTDLGPNFLIDLVTDTSVHVGSINVTLPTEVGTYTMDAITASDPDVNRSAQIHYDFANPTQWRANDGQITGGTYDFTVIPEPATLALLGLGAVAALRRRVA